MDSRRISYVNARENISSLADIGTDESDAGSEYNDEHFSEDDFSSEEEIVEELSSDEDDNGDQEIIARHIDESIQSVIRITMGDQSFRQFEPTADRTSKAGVVWNKLDVGSSTKVRNCVKFTGKSGPTRYGCSKIDDTALSAFKCLFDDSMTKKIIIHTNSEAERSKDSFRLTDEIFMKFIGLLICRGVFCRGVSVQDLWSKEYGMPIISKLLSKNKFIKMTFYR